MPSFMPSVSLASIARKIKRPILFSLLFLALFSPLLVEASSRPLSQLLANPDFETGNMNGWTSVGGTGGVQTNRQHGTPFWGPARPDVDTWNGYIQPKGQYTQLGQYHQVQQGKAYRLSAWVSTSGMATNLARYSSLSGMTYCGSSSAWTYTPLSCEFFPTANENMAFGIDGNAASGAWAGTDDFALTEIVTAPRWQGRSPWSPLPATYYIGAGGYPTRTDMAAGSWNTAMGKTMLQKTSNSGQAKILVNFSSEGFNNRYGLTSCTSPCSVVTITINKSYLDTWNNTNYDYGLEARQGILAHEFGHALGLWDLFDYCQLMNTYGQQLAWYCMAYEPTSGDVQGMRILYP